MKKKFKLSRKQYSSMEKIDYYTIRTDADDFSIVEDYEDWGFSKEIAQKIVDFLNNLSQEVKS